MTPTVAWGDDERALTDSVSVLVGADGGKYPSVNSLLVRGSGETVVIDPSITVVARGGAPVPVDAVVNSHSHEDHMAATGSSPMPASTSTTTTCPAPAPSTG